MRCKACNKKDAPVFIGPNDYYCETCYGEITLARHSFSIADLERILGVNDDEDLLETLKGDQQ